MQVQKTQTLPMKVYVESFDFGKPSVPQPRYPQLKQFYLPLLNEYVFFKLSIVKVNFQKKYFNIGSYL